MTSGPAPLTPAGSPAVGIPTTLTSFVGRDDESAQARHLLESARLVTLTGPGGVGKTRPAARVLTESAPAFADGAVFVGLASARHGAMVPKLVAGQLNLQDRAQPPVTGLVISYLHERSVLIEHILAKLSLRNRAQIASWVWAMRSADGD